VRSDDSWFHCSFTVAETSTGLELLAYSFEVRLCPGMGTPFVRYDLNAPGHANEARDLRCHIHPGNDDIMLPAPLLSPMELLSLFLRETATYRKSRTLTEFELNWLRESHALIGRED
jgi:hypothetical protein